MAEKPLDTSQKQESSKDSVLDLNALSKLNFGPSWADENKKKPSVKQNVSSKETRRKDKSFGKSNQRDRRSSSGDGQQRGGRSQGDGTSSRNQGDRGKGNKENKGNRFSQTTFFEPTIKVDIYPQDEAFEVLVKRLRSTVRTYQLFEIAHLILEKPERYIVAVENKIKKDEKPVPLYFSVPEQLPFETEEAAINYVLNNHLNVFFDIESIEVEPPKGNFQMVNRCTITGELLGPPNDHRYQDFLRRHYTSNINGMSFGQFVSKIETVKDQDSIDAWVESMKKGARYILKERKENEPESFESFEAMRMFLLQHRKDSIVGSSETVRFSGRYIDQLPQGSLRRSVEKYIEQQIHFPLDTANNIRGRLRRHKFTVYKKGSKGISYVCAVRRKFRDSKTIFSSSIQNLIEFIEQHPNVPVAELPKRYIGIDTEKQKPTKLEMDEAKAFTEPLKSEEATVETDDATVETDDATVELDDAVVESEEARVETDDVAVETDDVAVETDDVAVETDDATVMGAPAADTDSAASSDATVVIETKSTVGLNEAELKQLKQLMLDLRWLVFEGYVTEYGDSRLFAPPPMPETKKEKALKENASEEVTEMTTSATSEKAIKQIKPEAQINEADSEDNDEVTGDVKDSPDLEKDT